MFILCDGYASINKYGYIYSTIMLRLKIGIDIREIQRCWKDGSINT
jgi:hypothetical protein